MSDSNDICSILNTLLSDNAKNTLLKSILPSSISAETVLDVLRVYISDFSRNTALSIMLRRLGTSTHRQLLALLSPFVGDSRKAEALKLLTPWHSTLSQQDLIAILSIFVSDNIKLSVLKLFKEKADVNNISLAAILRCFVSDSIKADCARILHSWKSSAAIATDSISEQKIVGDTLPRAPSAEQSDLSDEPPLDVDTIVEVLCSVPTDREKLVLLQQIRNDIIVDDTEQYAEVLSRILESPESSTRAMCILQGQTHTSC